MEKDFYNTLVKAGHDGEKRGILLVKLALTEWLLKGEKYKSPEQITGFILSINADHLINDTVIIAEENETEPDEPSLYVSRNHYP
jgi:hypothetical protein